MTEKIENVNNEAQSEPKIDKNALNRILAARNENSGLRHFLNSGAFWLFGFSFYMAEKLEMGWRITMVGALLMGGLQIILSQYSFDKMKNQIQKEFKENQRSS